MQGGKAGKWVVQYWKQAMLAVAVVASVGVAHAVWRANRALSDSAEKVESESIARFSLSRLDRAAPAGFEQFASPSSFLDAALFQGKLYICGSGGLFSIGSTGEERPRFRTGMELPPAVLTSMAVGVAADSNEPELWIGTSGEGLFAFNGKSFRHIDPEESDVRRVTTVLPLKTGRILFGTDRRGVFVYDGKNIAPFHPSMAGVKVTAMAGDDADLWVGTLDRGLLHWRAGEIQHFGEQDGLPDAQVLSIALSGDRAFAGTAMGVAEFQGGKFVRVLGEGFLAQALAAGSGSLMVGTLNEGIVRIPLAARGRMSRDPESGGPAGVHRLLQLDERLYAVADNGLFTSGADGASWTSVLDKPAGQLTDRNISALSVDSAGKLWAGYFDRGLDIIDTARNDASVAIHVEDDHVFCVNRIVEDRERNLTAVATANGLALFDGSGKLKQVLGKSDGLIADQVMDVLIRPGGMTIATAAGLTIFDSGGARSLYAFHGLVNNHAYALAGTGNKVLVGTLGGLSVLDSGIVSANYTTSNSRLKHNWVTAIVPWGGDWLVGTYGAGVEKMDGAGQWTSFPDWKGEMVVNPNAMLATESAVYAGTLGRGLGVYHKDSGRWTFMTEGLPSLNVTALAARKGVLYIGTDNGLVRAEERNVWAR